MDPHNHRHPRVVVAVENTFAGYAAVRVAVGLARGSRMPLQAISASVALMGASADAIEAAFQEAMAGVPTDIDLTRTVCHSSPSTALAEQASDPRDLIVVGDDARSGLRGLWNGSTARNVLPYARCQVLVVPAPEMQRSTRRSLRRLRRARTDVWDRFEIEVPQLRGEPFHGI